MKSKTINILKWTPSVLISAFIIMGAAMKLAEAPQLVEIYSRIGLLEYMKVLGIIEILFVAVFLYPPTMKIGFLLLTGFYGGAMATEFSHGAVFVFPACILAVIWISAALRNKRIFVNNKENNKSQQHLKSSISQTPIHNS